MFTVEVLDSESHPQVNIYVDRSEIQQLIVDLEQLIASKDWRTVHLFTASWGGDALTENRMNAESLLAHHLAITVVADDLS